MRKLVKYLSVFVLTFFVKFGYSQVYQVMAQYGYGPVKRFDVDSTLTIPTVCGVPLLRSTLTKKTAIAYDSCNNRFYIYNPKTLTWSQLSGGGGETDTTSLSDRINLKLNISDTINKWVTAVYKYNDTSIIVLKNGVRDTIILSGGTASSATKLVTQVYNNSGATITKGSVVYINGAHSSNLPTIALAQANVESTSAYTYGLVQDNILDNSSGTVIQNGTITNLNLPTSTYTDGQTLYLSPTVAGGYTLTKPTAPNHYVAIGTITRAHPNFGTIQVAIRNGFQLDEMSDVKIAIVPADSTLLQFSRVDSLWHDVSVTNAIGSKYIKPSDTATMLSTYSKTITVNTKLNISDTTVFQRKNIAANSFMANNTYQSANATTQTFKDTSYTLSGSDITWSGTTAPSGTKEETIRYVQVGKMVNVTITLYYQTAGAANTAVTVVFPSNMPTPYYPSAMGAASRMIATGQGAFSTNYQQPASFYRGGLRRNSGNTANEFFITFTSGSGAVNWAQLNLTYYTN